MTQGLDRKLETFLPPSLSVDGLYGSLRHGSRQRPLAWSSKNVAIAPSWVPDAKVPGLMNPSLRLLSLLMSSGGKAKLWDTCMEDISMFHGQSSITHILWNHSGNYFTSIDEKGKIVIWANKRYLNTWLPVYMLVLFNTAVCCEWINPERMYIASKSEDSSTYEREKTGRPRSPLALVILTSDGQLTTFFKPAGQVFSHISTNLPRRSGTDELLSSRISHGSIMSDAGGIHLATHSSSILPSTVDLYQIDLRFSPEVVFRCGPLAILHISTPLSGPGSVMTPNVVHHLQLLPQNPTRPFSIAVALASRKDDDPWGEASYQSQLVVWDITTKVMGFHPAFQELSTRRNDAASGQPSLAFVLSGERQFQNKFISALTFIPRSRELVAGFSDGSIIGFESQFPGLLDATSTHSDGFRQDRGDSAIVAIQPSPNGLALLCSTLDGQLSCIVPQNALEGLELEVDSLVQSAIIALLNEWDYSDIVSTITRASKVAGSPDLIDKFLAGVFKSYEFIRGAEDSSMMEPFLPKASVMRRMLALQLVVLQANSEKIVQFRATYALLHLQSIGEVFMGCCTSDPSILAAHLDSGNVGTLQHQLSFDTDSLWSLLPLCGWVLDFCTVLFRELTVFLNMKTASSTPQDKDSASTQGPEMAPNLLCFLYHGRARQSLRSVLILVEQFHQYVRVREQLYARVIQTSGAIEGGSTGQGGSNHTNSMSIAEAIAMKDVHFTFLAQYLDSAMTRCPLKIGVVKSMLKDLNGIGGQSDLVRANGGITPRQGGGENGVFDKSATDHVVFIRGTIPLASGSSLAQAKTELRMVTRRYPTLWDTNRLIFSTIHWLDLEPASALTRSTADLDRFASAIHPSRCRIDPVMALKTRNPMGRIHPGALHHPSSVGSLLPLGGRGSSSGPLGKMNGGVAQIFSEPSGELQTRHSSFSEIARGASSSWSRIGLGQLRRETLSVWGMTDDSVEVEDGAHTERLFQGTDEAKDLKSTWVNWNSLQEQMKHGQDEVAETETEDEIMQDEDGDEDEDVYSDEEPLNSGNGSRRGSRGSLSRVRRLSLSMASSRPWLLRESRIISQRTPLHWTVFPILSNENQSVGRQEAMLDWTSLKEQFTSMDLQTIGLHSPAQGVMEAQARKRRMGSDPVRKMKKYKSTGRGRQCIRCLQISTTNGPPGRSASKGAISSGGSATTIPDIAAATLWYHNYDRSCICGGMWLEL